MSDYFSVKPSEYDGYTNTSDSTDMLTPSYNTIENNVNPGDFASFASTGSQYLMDMIPDALTLKDNATYSHINTKDYILPKTDVRSPYYIAIPIPNPLATSAITNTAVPEEGGKDSTDDDGFFVREFPTDILIDRFYKWKKILKSIITYLREVAYAQEQFARINHKLKGSIKFPFLTDIQDGSNKIVDPLYSAKPAKKQQPVTLAQQKEQRELMQQREMEMELENPTLSIPQHQQQQKSSPGETVSAASGFMKFGSGSIQDIQVILKKHHLALASQQFKISKEIISTLIPKLESLRKDLTNKIKEIKDLHGDFKTNINAHVKLTSHLLNKYIASVKFVNKTSGTGRGPDELEPKHDPFLLKLQLDLQLKRQISEENYLQEAYVNLQTSGLKLEKIIFSKIQHTLQRYSYLIDAEARLMIKNLCQELQHGLLSKPPALEWDHFVSYHPLCLMSLKSNDPLPRARKLSDIVYPNMKASMAKCMRAGYFKKKSNFIKEYKKGYFVLTPNYLHEFKSSNFFSNPSVPSGTNSGTTTPSMSAGSSSTQLNQFNEIISMTPMNNDAINDYKNNATVNSLNTKKVNSLTPILSIPLNECKLTEYSDTHFTITGKATFIDTQRRKLNSTTSSSSLSKSAHVSSTNLLSAASTLSLNPLENESTKYITKKSASAFSKLLLKPVKGKQSKQAQAAKKEEKRVQDEYNKAVQQESNQIVTWMFKCIEDHPTDEDKRHFRKWVQDLKSLCSYNKTSDRIKFIDDRIVKTQHQRTKSRQAQIMSNYTINQSNNGSTLVSENSSIDYSQMMLNPSLNNTTNSLTATISNPIAPKQSVRANKPQYIPLHNTAAMDLNQGFRSKINTPAIDDNGNLITLAERKPAYVRAASAGSLSPQPFPTSVQSPNISNESDTSALNTMAYNSQDPIDVSITSNGMRAQSNQLSPSHMIRHQRNISLPSGLAAFSPIHSPSELSIDSNNSQGGYFAIPVDRNGQQNYQMPTSLYHEDQVKQVTGQPLSRTSSRGQIIKSRQPSTGSIPNNNIMSLPKVHLNNQEMKGPILTRLPPKLQKQSSTGSLPTMKVLTPNEQQSSDIATPPLTNISTPLYQKGNGSATNLSVNSGAVPAGARVHSYRKHKKNVSFGSLNSLMFSKKNGIGSTYNSGQLMSGGIREDEDSDDANSTHGSIKLNQSIYS